MNGTFAMPDASNNIVDTNIFYASPIGPLRIDAIQERGVWVVSAVTVLPLETRSNSAFAEKSPGDSQPELLTEAVAQLDDYFKGERRVFDLPLATAASSFQARLRAAMIAIPYGRTARYADLAREIDSSPRAIGTGCGRNPIPIVVPCHRVVATGGLGGYSGGQGLATKRDLIALEKSSGKNGGNNKVSNQFLGRFT